MIKLYYIITYKELPFLTTFHPIELQSVSNGLDFRGYLVE